MKERGSEPMDRRDDAMRETPMTKPGRWSWITPGTTGARRWQAGYRCACNACATSGVDEWSYDGMPVRRWKWLARIDAWQFRRRVIDESETCIASWRLHDPNTETRCCNTEHLRGLPRLRAAFESWIGAPPYEMTTARFRLEDARNAPLWEAWPGHYRVYKVQLAWEAWQEAVRQERRS